MQYLFTQEEYDVLHNPKPSVTPEQLRDEFVRHVEEYEKKNPIQYEMGFHPSSPLQVVSGWIRKALTYTMEKMKEKNESNSKRAEASRG